MNAFMSTLEHQYKFINLKSLTQIQTVNGDNDPFFLAPDNTPLNKFYQPIIGPVTAVPTGKSMLIDPYTKDQYFAIFRPQEIPQFSMPNPNNFNSKEQYESALLAWFYQANKYLLSVVLPTPITSYFYVPSLPKIFTHEEKTSLLRYKTFKANVWPLLPKNYLHMIDLLFSNQPIYPNIPFPEQIPKREPIFYLHHITHEQQWMGQMIPAEPKPFIYDKVEDFEKAYDNWSIITFNCIEKPPIPPNQFGEIASLRCYYIPNHKKESDVGESLPPNAIKRKKKKYPMKNITKPKLLIDLHWSDNKKIQSISNISNNLQKLFNALSKPKNPILDSDPVMDVFGIEDKSIFVNEMIEYGCNFDSLKLNKPVHPTYFLLGAHAANSNYIVNLLCNPNNYSMAIFYKMLDINFSNEQYIDILSSSVDDPISNGHTIIANLVDSYLNNQQKIMSLLSYSQKTTRHSIRLSYFLRSLFNLNSNNELFFTIIQPSYIVLFYHIISIINITSSRHITLTPMIRNFKNTPLMKINHLYLIQSFLILFNENDNPQFYQKILEKLYSFFSSFYRSLARQESFLNSLREAAVDTDEYKALLMLMQCESPSIHQLILGDKFLIWMNQGPKRPILLWTIAHSTSMMSAAILFVKTCSNISKFNVASHLRSDICFFISAICKYIFDYAEPLNICFNGKKLIQFFLCVLSFKKLIEIQMLEPLSLLLSSYKLISNFNSWEYRQHVADAINMICKSIVEAKYAFSAYCVRNCLESIQYMDIYIIRMKTLLNFMVYYESIYQSILQINNFIEEVTSYLSTSDEKALRVTWRFFNKFTQDATVLEGVLKKPTVQQNLSSIFSKNNKVSQSKMLKFTAKVWLNNDPKYLTSKKYLCDIINPVISTIINAYTLRFTIYKDELIIQKRIKDFFNAIEQLSTVPVCQEFAQRVTRRVNDDVSNLKSRVK